LTKGRGEQLTRHHKIPKSRGGGDEPSNIKIVKARIHRAWHTLFQNSDKTNMTPIEALEQVKEWAVPDLSSLGVYLPTKKRHAWNLVFGENTTPAKAIKIITKEWS